MYLPLIVSSVLINFVSADDLHLSVKKTASLMRWIRRSVNRILRLVFERPESAVLAKFIQFHGQDDTYLSKNGKDNNAVMGSNGRTNTTPYNITYIDKAENLIRLPAMNKYYEEKKGKRKTFKKSPRRTIQKIIKKNGRAKIKKLYVVKMTSSHPTIAPNDFDNEQDDYSPRKAEMTTRPNQQKKIKKFNVKQVKLPRYPMPYRKMQTRKNIYKRPKRETRDIFIFKDFDSMQFVKGKTDDDYNVVNAHFKKQW